MSDFLKCTQDQVLPRFPLPIFIPPISPQSPSPIIRGWYNMPVVAAVPRVPPQKFKLKKDEVFITSTRDSAGAFLGSEELQVVGIHNIRICIMIPPYTMNY
jgi:hypothetical protein